MEKKTLTKHTPEPWTIGIGLSIRADRQIIAQIKNIAAGYNVMYKNAVLMAAAPGMLIALKIAYNKIGEMMGAGLCPCDCTIGEELKQAIAKAEGR